MAKQVQVIKKQQQQIVKLLQSMDGKFNRWEIWQDFILMMATSIANRFQDPHGQEREETYLKAVKKYSKKELGTFAEMCAYVVEGMDQDPEQDFLGSLFMALELGSNWKGQFFTPYNVCQMMGQVSGVQHVKEQLENRGWVVVNDPACGAGATLIALANECKKAGINYQQKILFTGQDLDRLAAMMCYIQLSLLGCPGYVVIGDTLLHPATAYDKRSLLPTYGQDVWFTPMYYSDIWAGRQIAASMDLLIGRMNTRTVKEKVPAGLLFF